MKFTIDYSKALKLQKKISNAKDNMKEKTEVTIRVNTEGDTDLFATNGHIMGAFFSKENNDQEEMNLQVFDDEKVFTVDLRPLDKIKKMIHSDQFIDCDLRGSMLHMALNNFGEELTLRTDDNKVFDKFIDILSYDKYTDDFNGETIIDTEMLSKVAFGKEVRLQRGIEHSDRFLVTDSESNYRGVILGKTVEIQSPEDNKDQDEMNFGDSLQDKADKIKLKNIMKGESTAKNIKKLNKLADSIVPDGMKVTIEHNNKEIEIGDKR